MMTMRGVRIRISLALATFAVALAPLPAAAQDITREASTFVQTLGNEAIQIQTDKTLTALDREQRFHDMFVAGFDVPAIARFVLGRYRRTATDAQKVEFERLFEAMMVRTYANRFTQYKGEPFVVTASREEGENHAMVTTTLVQSGGVAEPIKIDWRVLKPEGNLKIVDVVIEGVSMSLTQQQEFGSVIQRNGGQLESLLATMRTRVQQQTSAAPIDGPSR